MIDFYDYGWDDVELLRAEAVFVDGSARDSLPSVQIHGLDPRSLVAMVRNWDEDVIAAFITKITSEDD